MDDKCLMENMLLTTKGVCDLYMHGTIESATANVHCALAAKGWYPSEQAEPQKIQKVKQKYSANATN